MLIDIQPILDNDRLVLSWFNGSSSVFLDQWMAVLTSGFTWMPLYAALLYLVIKNNETMAQILLVIGCVAVGVVAADVVADLWMKPFVGRWRPSNDPIYKYSVCIVNGVRGSDFGFFSAHAANTFTIAMFFCLLVRDRILGTTLVLWSLLNCYTRMYLGLHYPLDIICGLAWGAVSGSLSYCLFRRLYNRITPANNFVSSQYTATGYNLRDIDIVMLVFVCTIVYTIIKSIIVYI